MPRIGVKLEALEPADDVNEVRGHLPGAIPVVVIITVDAGALPKIIPSVHNRYICPVPGSELQHLHAGG